MAGDNSIHEPLQVSQRLKSSAKLRSSHAMVKEMSYAVLPLLDARHVQQIVNQVSESSTLARAMPSAMQWWKRATSTVPSSYPSISMLLSARGLPPSALSASKMVAVVLKSMTMAGTL